MKTIVVLTSLAALTIAASAQAAPPAAHQPGAPIQQGQYCWVYTDARGSGWWDRCDGSATPRGRSLQGRDNAQIAVFGDSGGGGGGGGGGR